MRMFSLSAAALGLALATASAQADGGSDLTIEVNGLKDANGQVMVMLWNAEDNWLEFEKATRQATIAIDKNQAHTTLKGLPAGTYAFCVVHDANKNGKLDTKFPRRPAEAVGCSRGAKGSFGPPKWKDAQFALSGKPETLKVSVDYP